MTHEHWKTIPGYEGLYEVSSAGAVRSVDRSHTAKNSHTGLPMKRTLRGRTKQQTPDRDGYHHVRLCKDGVAKNLLVSRIVLLTFVGEAQGKEACHKNHNRADNSLTNLVWGDRQENEKQKDLAGRRPLSTRGKLTKELVMEIRRRYASGSATYKQIAAELGVHFSTVGYAVNQKTWSTV